MQVKRFVGRTVPEVLQKVKADLGPDAVIVQTQMVRRRGALRLLGGDRVEIVAGVGFALVSPYTERRIRSEALTPRRPAAIERAYGAAPVPESIRRIFDRGEAGRPDLFAAASEAQGPKGGSVPRREPSAAVETEIRDIKRMLSEVQDRIVHDKMGDCPPELFQEYLALLQNAVSDELAQRLIREIRGRLKPEDLRDARILRNAIRTTLESMIPVAGPIRLREGRCTRVMFIGPTGVGKTTTIAKLAAHHRYVLGKDVALITNDTYRLAATEQLRKAAEIMGIPLRPVPAGRDMPAALKELEDFDLVLVDTAGRSQRDAGRMSELQELTEAVNPDEVHLVVSLTTHPENLLEIVRRFSACRVDALVLTKLDEAARFGLILDVLGKVEKSLSYVTTGQTIPKDIEVASPGRISGLIVGESAVA